MVTAQDLQNKYGNVDLSLAIPLYDEERNVECVTRDLMDVLDATDLNYEIVLVDNGSRDSTGRLIDKLTRTYANRLRRVSIPVNEGYGLGVIKGLEPCRGRFVGYLVGDGQVDPADVPKIYEAARTAPGHLAKGYRIGRKDGSMRKMLSLIYNTSFRLFYGVKVRDVSGTPKVLARDLLDTLGPKSRNSFFDAELLIKANALGIGVVEVPIQDHSRRAGRSHVDLNVIRGMFATLARYRFSRELRRWKSNNIPA
jgi:glycosyltransferase involved in cell wall biosynthesis